MNPYKLNISINLIMLLSKYEPTKSTHKNNSNNSIKSISQIKIQCWPFWENLLNFFGKSFDFVDLFKHLLNQLNWFNHTSRSKAIDSITYFMKKNWLNSQSTHLEKELNKLNQFCGKKWIDSNQSTQSSWLVYKSDQKHCSPSLFSTGALIEKMPFSVAQVDR